MKFKHFIPLCIAVALSAPLLCEADQQDRSRGKTAMRDVATNDQLVAKFTRANREDPIRELGPAIGDREVDPSKQIAERDLIKSSTLICYRGFLTLVPKRAVLHVPEKLKDRIGPRPGVKIKTWREFYIANRGWIRTIEVTRPQALGHVSLSESALEAISDSSSLVIATFKEGPISVLPLKDPEEVPTPSESKPVTYRK
jgi:hypothetical protein